MILRSLMLSLAVAAGAAQAEEKMAAKPDPAKAQQTASTLCAGCHAADGNSVAAANPKLAGQHQEYLYKQLKNFKTPEGKPDRNNAIMGGMVAALSDDDMRGLATYFAGQKLKPESAKDAKSVEAGKKLYRAGDAAKGLPACAGCHGPSGAGIPAQYPRLSGQFAEYTEAQLKAFRAGERANDPNQMMRMIALKMSDPDIKAVSDYVAGLR
ncbi:MAG: cytochrome c4 [Sterolibacteriaceae bacterium]|nr:cytochrome c4 [Candidatus Methylophosphatis haderslevensis]